MADLVTFDPVTVADAATYTDPARYPVGIVDVIVNGQAAVLAARRPASDPAACCGGPDAMAIERTGAIETTERVRLPGGPLDYTLRRSPRARTLRVLIHPQRGVVVTIPSSARRGWGAPERHVESFLGQREPWLRRHLARQARDRADLAARGGLRDGATLRYPRRPASAPHRAGPARRKAVVRGARRRDRGGRDRRPPRAAGPALDGGPARGLVQASRPDRDRSRDRQARRRPAGHAVSVGVRDQRTRWGSASRQGRLSFSWRLILAPPEALETVVIHELAHLRVFGHGPRFWALVASRRPDHATWRTWLHDHSHELHGALDPTEGQD